MRSDALRFALIGAAVSLLLVFLAGGIFFAGLRVGRLLGVRQVQQAMEENIPAQKVPGPKGLQGEKNGLGARGTITAMDGTTITMVTLDGTTKTVIPSPSVVVRSEGETAELQDLRVGDFIIIIGEPQGDGSFLARIIRRPEK